MKIGFCCAPPRVDGAAMMALAASVGLALLPAYALGQAEPLVGLPGSTNEAPLLGANVEELLQWADSHNPELAALGYEIDAANARIDVAGALPDPMLRVTFMDIAGPGAPDDYNASTGNDGGTEYRVGQTFPWWGKRGLRKEVASAQVAEARGSQQVGRAEIHARIKRAYAEYYQAVGLKRLNDEILQLLTDLEALAQVRYSGGLVPQQDVIRVQVERTMLRSERIELDTGQHHAMSGLNVAMGRPQSEPFAEPQALREVPAVLLDSPQLFERITRSNPQLAMQSARVAAADASQRLVHKERFPDFTLMLSPTQMDGRISTWEAMVEVNLPIRFDTRRARESEAAAMLAAERERRQAMENQVAGFLREALTALEAAEKQEQLVTGTLVPQAELTFNSAMAGYETGQVDIDTLFEAQRALKRARQDSLRAQVAQELYVAEIENMLGEEL
jgi:cobalt-zinc-cadmium efflux system outer membrane protein